MAVNCCKGCTVYVLGIAFIVLLFIIPYEIAGSNDKTMNFNLTKKFAVFTPNTTNETKVIIKEKESKIRVFNLKYSENQIQKGIGYDNSVKLGRGTYLNLIKPNDKVAVYVCQLTNTGVESIAFKNEKGFCGTLWQINISSEKIQRFRDAEVLVVDATSDSIVGKF